MPDIDYFPDTEKGGERADALWEDHKSFYQEDHRQILQELAFALDQEHYKNEKANDLETAYIPFKDGSLFNLIRHKAAMIGRSTTYFRVYPQDEIEDPFHAEDARAAIRFEIDDPEKEFEETKEDVITGALAARMWAFTVNFDPTCGIDGEIIIQSMRPDRVTWTPGFRSPQSKNCPCVILEYDMLPQEIERMGRESVSESIRWKNVANLVPDGTAGENGDSSNAPTYQSANSNQGTTQTPTVKVLFIYERFRKDTVKRQRPDQVALDPGQRYMACPTCGYNEKGAAIDGAILPEMGGECPTCGSVLKRTDAEMLSDEILAYRKERSLTVRAPGLKRTFFEGDWPFDLKGFPVVMFKSYNHPLKAVPNSETFYYWTNQQMVNALYRMGYDQMRKAHLIIVAPEDALKDANGQPFGYSDYRDTAYYDQSEVQGSPSQWLHAFQPPGLNAAWPSFLSAVQGSFTMNKGTTDLGMTPTQSKDIAVGTIEAFIKTGEIPVDHQIKRFQRVMSILLTRVYEMIRSTWTEAKAVRLFGPDGSLMFKRLRGDSLAGADVIVSAEPDMAQLRELEGQEVMAILQLPPPARKLMWKIKGLSPQMLEEYQADEKMFQAQQMLLQQEAQQQAVAQNGNGMATGSPPAMSQAA